MMSLRLLLRSLWYFRGTNLALLLGMAVATAVLAGALLVGDSVRGSLEELARLRLGPVDHAVVSQGMFDESLARRVMHDAGFARHFAEAEPAILLRGRAASGDGTRGAAGVQIIGMRNGWVPVERGAAVINGPLADALGMAGPGGSMVLSMPGADTMPRDAVLARRGRSESISGLRVNTAAVLRDAGMATLFGLTPSQREGRNAWVDLEDLQNALEEPGRANLLLVGGEGGGGGGELRQILRRVVTLEDYGLSLAGLAGTHQAALTARQTYMAPAVEAAADSAATMLKIVPQKISTYLLTDVRKVADGAAETVAQGTGPATAPQADGGGRAISYAIAAGVSSLDGGALGPDEAALNQWAAERLGAKVGDRIRLSYLQRQENGDLVERTAEREFTVARILPMLGIGADPLLTPAFKGFTDADTVHDWNPPAGFPFHRARVTDADEAYWKEYRAAPKVFLSLATAEKLWRGPYGGLTSVRVPAESREAFGRELLARLDPELMGMRVVPLRAEQLAAAGGSTDFSMLFVGFSFFLIAAGVLLVALLFRLGAEQRARQFGLLMALGFTPRAVYWQMLAEGALLAVAGGLLGLAGAVGYTWLMVAGLRTWWVAAVGTTHMRLFVDIRTLEIGFAAGVIVALGAVVWGVRLVRRAEPVTLLAGGTLMPAAAGRRAGRWLGGLTAAFAVIGGAFAAAGALRVLQPQGAFLGSGASLLAAGLAASTALLQPGRKRTDRGGGGKGFSVSRLGLENATRRPARSVLTVGLIALASFILVTVAAMRLRPPEDVRLRPSGTGGYARMVTADIPLLGDLNTVAGRELLGITSAKDPLWERAKFVGLRRRQGQDISCLNMTQATRPTILAAPAELRGRWVTARSAKGTEALALLDVPQADGTIPVVADDETATYLLKLNVGETIIQADQDGRPQRLKLVGTLSHSIFQSQLLMGERDFQRLFPRESGYGVVLAEVAAGDEAAVSRELYAQLDEYGVMVESTADRLATYNTVANTYLATFQTLGALGLLLGTIGLAVVLLRNLLERRAELALLTALGFTPGRRMRLVLEENLLLLALGLAIGAGAALLGVLPSWRAIHFGALGLTLLAVLACGTAALAVALLLGARRLSPAMLRAE